MRMEGGGGGVNTNMDHWRFGSIYSVRPYYGCTCMSVWTKLTHSVSLQASGHSLHASFPVPASYMLDTSTVSIPYGVTKTTQLMKQCNTIEHLTKTSHNCFTIVRQTFSVLAVGKRKLNPISPSPCQNLRTRTLST